MAWDPNVAQQLQAAFRDRNIPEFKRLLKERPDHLRAEDGADVWMWQAAMNRNLPVLKALVDLGMDVNETHDSGDASDPFYEPEGPILQAATIGDAEMVAWLLQHGAKINYTVSGAQRCLPLIRASTEGHLDVVKLLVQHGADVESTWEGLSAVSQAEKFGHDHVRDYLRSLRRP